ncbi:MAG: hypothetical protein BWX71_01727 [Deltaproteobacteria bacterium ADurb.Bin072]|nr:MAG: hypothetical protein BWX71_01727 [Deltaproteobacteria bacterium ADurb.Bin072]
MSRALWCVRKGFAVAPPGMLCIMGVSTSRNPRASMYRLRAPMILVRVMKVCFTSGETMRST